MVCEYSHAYLAMQPPSSRFSRQLRKKRIAVARLSRFGRRQRTSDLCTTQNSGSNLSPIMFTLTWP